MIGTSLPEIDLVIPYQEPVILLIESDQPATSPALHLIQPIPTPHQPLNGPFCHPFEVSLTISHALSHALLQRPSGLPSKSVDMKIL